MHVRLPRWTDDSRVCRQYGADVDVTETSEKGLRRWFGHKKTESRKLTKKEGHVVEERRHTRPRWKDKMMEYLQDWELAGRRE